SRSPWAACCNNRSVSLASPAIAVTIRTDMRSGLNKGPEKQDFPIGMMDPARGEGSFHDQGLAYMCETTPSFFGSRHLRAWRRHSAYFDHASGAYKHKRRAGWPVGLNKKLGFPRP